MAWGILSGSQIISPWRWVTFPCAAGCNEGISLPSLLRGIGIGVASLWTGDGGYLLAFFSTFTTHLVHIIPQCVHKYSLMMKAASYQLSTSGTT